MASERREITDLERLRFRAILNAHYHEDSERFFHQTHRLLMLVVVLSGLSAVASGVSASGISLAVPAATAALAGLFDLGFDLFGRAALHKQLRWRALDIYADSSVAGADVGSLATRLSRILTDEPPTNPVLNKLAFNRASEALGFDKRNRYVIPTRTRLLRHFGPWTQHQFKTVGDIEAE